MKKYRIIEVLFLVWIAGPIVAGLLPEPAAKELSQSQFKMLLEDHRIDSVLLRDRDAIATDVDNKTHYKVILPPSDVYQAQLIEDMEANGVEIAQAPPEDRSIEKKWEDLLPTLRFSQVPIVQFYQITTVAFLVVFWLFGSHALGIAEKALKILDKQTNNDLNSAE